MAKVIPTLKSKFYFYDYTSEQNSKRIIYLEKISQHRRTFWIIANVLNF